jgi:ATP-dependent DNA ligase
MSEMKTKPKIIPKKEVKKQCREKSLFDRASKIAKKKWNDQQNKEGFGLTKEISQIGRPFVTPMLAHPLKLNKIVFPCYVQPKIDGFRAMASVSNSIVELLSRKNIPYKGFSNLKKDIQTFVSGISSGFGSGCLFIDGELLIPDVPDAPDVPVTPKFSK